jgi:hypothetical protein
MSDMSDEDELHIPVVMVMMVLLGYTALGEQALIENATRVCLIVKNSFAHRR